MKTSRQYAFLLRHTQACSVNTVHLVKTPLLHKKLNISAMGLVLVAMALRHTGRDDAGVWDCEGLYMGYCDINMKDSWSSFTPL